MIREDNTRVGQQGISVLARLEEVPSESLSWKLFFVAAFFSGKLTLLGKAFCAKPKPSSP